VKPGDRPRYSRPNLRVRCVDASDVHDVLIKGAIYLAQESANPEMYIVNGRSFLRTRFEPVTDDAKTCPSVLPDEVVEDFPTSGPDEITDPVITVEKPTEKKEGER
jgi:hypothetical protein